MALFCKTILWICLMSCIGLSKALFLRMGVFQPQYYTTGVNAAHCGHRLILREREMFYTPQCNLNRYPNRTIDLNRDRTLPFPQFLSHHRIAFAREAFIFEAPWTVFITFYRGIYSVSICTGTLITLQWVVTAAHCLYGPGGVYPFFTHAIVLGGTVYKLAGTQRRSTFSQANWWEHPLFDFNNLAYASYDIALMRLDYQFQLLIYSQFYYLNTICVPAEDQQLNVDEDDAQLTGYGMVELNAQTNWLRIAEVTLLPSAQCIIAGTVCANYLGQPGQPARPCAGDSGGGLYQYIDVRATLVGPLSGVYNHTPGCGEGIYYSDWIPVPRLIPWILAVLYP